MSIGLYRKWPLSFRRSRKLPRTFNPDDLLRRTPAELVELLVGRLQELWPSQQWPTLELPSRARSVEDFSLIGIALVRVVDALLQAKEEGRDGS